jgi:ankyrin repeat protein
MVGLLIDAGAHLEERDKSDHTPLHTAVSRGHLDAAQILTQAGADVHARTDRQTTPLHKAAYRGDVDAIDLLLKRGADVNARGNREEGRAFRGQGGTVITGVTPLHAVAACGHLSAAARLLRAGADTGAQRSDGLTPADVALREGQVEMRNFLSRVSAACR